MGRSLHGKAHSHNVPLPVIFRGLGIRLIPTLLKDEGRSSNSKASYRNRLSRGSRTQTDLNLEGKPPRPSSSPWHTQICVYVYT